MSLPVLLRPEAEDDARQARDQLDAARAGLGRQFLSQMRAVLERIEATPEIHGIVWKDVRAARLKRFRYVVYYVVLKERIDVLGILHGARSPSVYRSRT